MKKLLFTLFSLSISFFMMISCGKGKNDFTPKAVNLSLIGRGALYGNGSENIPKQNIVISNQNDFNILMSKMDISNNVSVSFTEKNIDFGNFKVIAVFSEIKSYGASSIDIVNITEYKHNIVVIVQNLLQEKDIPVINQPFHMVKIPKTTKTILFQ